MAVFEPLFKLLNEAGVRYVVVGGVAVVLHGYARLTVDIDLIVDLDEAEAAKVIDALVGSGLRPRAPVDPRKFSDPASRARWAREQGMQVFSMVDPANPMRVVDLFVENPVPFDELWSRSVEVRLEETTVRVASIPDLIRMKRAAGRAVDLEDVKQLEAILRSEKDASDV